MTRRRVKADKVHAVIVPMENGVGGMFRDKRHLYDEHEMRWRLWNIIVPCCSLLNASLTIATGWEQAKALRGDAVFPPDWDHQSLKHRQHLIGDVIMWSRGGETVPTISASHHARRKVREVYARIGKPVVTLTMRKTYLPERNSRKEDWFAAKARIEMAGYYGLLLHDTDEAMGRGSGFGEFNLDIRMACYQEAALNLQSNNGAASLCWFSDRPYRMFGAGVPAAEWEGLFVQQGLRLGESWPWARKDQKIVYGETSAQKIIAEFEAWKGEQKSAGAMRS